ncbi:26S proteasome non-ATPase regulatory subunit 4 homolog [Selaginella moellendorffii]|uniref:26S proteasome non-ATPase regulatory subunit 4 homolog n=1 Tax=Selaginella moellendorffii TaxID=88036 RepID=UPI000D1C6CC3|nr:26S proteasome non-ATPase regulatory subunit 4 homolog [Selaginella moellendorffii]|eukprot:XP_024530354.1 26S proteasome non-ATPase regulatory subunit 4 homolog [Selaginella moellendorffii]
MVLEATMICIDNSEWMRNGDYYPTSRFQSQADAVNLICGSKTQSHPENTVGILTTGGKGVRVLVTPTTDLGKILSCMHGVELGGESKITSAVQIAQLALKHRQNKNQRQRIVLFVGSPVAAEKKILETIGKKLKKNNVALDIVEFGQEDDTKSEKLEALLTSVNSNDNSHIVHVPPSSEVLTDALLSSPIFEGDGEGGSGFAAAAAAGVAAAAAAAAGGAGGFEFGVDPNLDPELALALRVSMEEERARQEAAAKRAADEQAPDGAPKGETSGAVAPPSDAPAAVSTEKGPDVVMDDESALLAQALAMSMNDAVGTSGTSADDTNMTEAVGEDQDLAFALEMSMQGEGSEGDMNKVLGDPSFMNSILASLPGVDPNDPSVRDVLAALQAEEEEVRKQQNDSSEKH